jgi:hydroxyacylglutathione hydrolase
LPFPDSSGEETWVVDPASDKDFLARLARTGKVTRVFLSHFHEDHLKYASFFRGAIVHAPLQEIEAFTSLEGMFALMGAPSRFSRNISGKPWCGISISSPSPISGPYQPGDRFATGDIVLEVMAAPGHTPGHSCFAFPEQDVIFLADVDLTPFGPWYGDAASDLEDYAETLRALKKNPGRDLSHRPRTGGLHLGGGPGRA